ncbi:MAG: efflux RND transporter periplasmic adaptor subunit [Syntrophomonas sp.]
MQSKVSGILQTKRNMVFLFLLILFIAAIVILVGYFSRQQAIVTQAHDSLTATGTIEATTVNAAFKIAGKIDQMYVDEGMEVKKDQVLAELDSREIKAKLVQAQGLDQAAERTVEQADKGVAATRQTVDAKIEQAQAGLTSAQQKYDRAKSLHDSGAIADSAFDDAVNNLQNYQGLLDEALAGRQKVAAAEAELLAAQGTSQQAKGGLQEVEAYMANTKLLSPINGFISIKYLEAGEMLNAGTPVFEISDLRDSYVKVYIDESKIGRVKLDQAAEVRVPAYPDQVFKGKVVKISDAGDFAVHKAINEMYSHDIRSFEVRVNIPNDDLHLKTGMTATVTILEKE